jgi:hypothetical protein
VVESARSQMYERKVPLGWDCQFYLCTLRIILARGPSWSRLHPTRCEDGISLRVSWRWSLHAPARRRSLVAKMFYAAWSKLSMCLSRRHVCFYVENGA